MEYLKNFYADLLDFYEMLVPSQRIGTDYDWYENFAEDFVKITKVPSYAVAVIFTLIFLTL